MRIPKDKSPESTLALLREAYAFIPNRCHALETDIFTTRLMLRKVICISGPEAGAFFYNNDNFKREGVMPERIQRTLTGSDGVQMLDGTRHRQRKAMFMALMGEESIAALTRLFAEEWATVFSPPAATDAVLFRKAQTALFCAVCRWSGVTFTRDEAAGKSRWLGDMVDGFGAVGIRHWRAISARRKSEAWARGIIRQARDANLPEGTALSVIIRHREGENEALETDIAAVELLNILRPVVAIATYIAFTAHALHRHPETAEACADAVYRHWFVQEVRRLYPFTPFLGAKTCTPLEWQGFRLPKNQLVLLDVHGINHDARLWTTPERFIPERFSQRQESSFDFMPQGGGSYHHHHRCAGESVTLALMEKALEMLTQHMDYRLEEGQELDLIPARIPTLPESGIRMTDIRLR